MYIEIGLGLGLPSEATCRSTLQLIQWPTVVDRIKYINNLLSIESTLLPNNNYFDFLRNKSESCDSKSLRLSKQDS